MIPLGVLAAAGMDSAPPVATFRAAVLATAPSTYVPMGDPSGAVAVALAGADGAYVGAPTLGRPKIIPNDDALSLGTAALADRCMVPQTWAGNGDVTFMLAVRSSKSADLSIVVDQDTGGSGVRRNFFALNRNSSGTYKAGAICLFNFDGGLNRDVAANDAYTTDGVPHLIVWGRASGEPFFYLDGAAQVASGALSTGDIQSGANWSVGQPGATSAGRYDGDVAHFAVWTRALTTGEVAAVFAASGL